MSEERTKLSIPTGSFWWLGSAWMGSKSRMRQVTKRGCRDTGYYVSHVWFSPTHQVSAISGSQCLGHYISEKEAQMICEQHFIEANSTKFKTHQPVIKK